MWFAAAKADAAQSTKPSLPDANSWSQRSKVFVVTDEYSIKDLADARNNLIGGVLWDRFPQEDNLMARIAQYASYGVGNAIIEKEFDRDLAA